MPIKRVAIFSLLAFAFLTCYSMLIVECYGSLEKGLHSQSFSAQLVKKTTFSLHHRNRSRLNINIMWLRLQSCTTGPHCKLMTYIEIAIANGWQHFEIWFCFRKNWFYNLILSIRRSSHEMLLARDVGAVSATGWEGDRQGMRSIDLPAQLSCPGINVSFLSISHSIRFLSLVSYRPARGSGVIRGELDNSHEKIMWV